VIIGLGDFVTMQRKESRFLPILIIGASAASVIITLVLAFYGIYFFFFFVPFAIGLPWSVKKLGRNKARKRWNIEDIR